MRSRAVDLARRARSWWRAAVAPIEHYVLVCQDERWHRATGLSYDAVAAKYDAAIGEELAGKPLDRALLAVLVEHSDGGLIADLGCGPGHVGAYLRALGASVVGIDLSRHMCALARRRQIPAATGDLVALPIATRSVAGLVCLYATIHLDVRERTVAFQEMRRVLAPGGMALVAFHTGDAGAQSGDERHFTNWFDLDVDLVFRFLDPKAEVATERLAGLGTTARLDRHPVADEHPSHRTYLLLERRPI